jgi:hypothetical protein
MTISNKLWASVLAMISIATPVIAVPTNAILPANPTPEKGKVLSPLAAVKAACLPSSTKTMIGTRYSGNPDSYNNFLWTIGAFTCTNNSIINTNGATTTPTIYRKSMYALKKATDTSAVPNPNWFKPFSWKTTGNCSAFQNTNGYKLNITSSLAGSPTTVTVKLCRDFNVSGIGDTARMRSVIFTTIAYYYAPTLTTLILKDRYGNVIN